MGAVLESIRQRSGSIAEPSEFRLGRGKRLGEAGEKNWNHIVQGFYKSLKGFSSIV